MGEYNSSVTRVWPVFDWLFHADPSGQSWISSLLHMGSRADQVEPSVLESPGMLDPELSDFKRKIPGPLKKVLGAMWVEQLGTIRNAYEINVPPATAFLRWLLENPERLQWPKAKGKELVYGAPTQANRKALIAGNPESKEKALRELAQNGTIGTQRKWWAFEGYTSVDCVLATDSLLVLIEGKRTEPMSTSTHWFPDRNQLIRNLECAREMARCGNKNFAVLVCAENIIDMADVEWEKSLPHMPEGERAELQSHFLGCATWNSIAAELCNGMKLPETVGAAAKLCSEFR
jgi:hypothetical protein